jgi:hypothetical protein
MRHTLTIGTRAQANKASTDTLFHPIDGHTATTHGKYDLGKYRHDLRGRTLEVPTDVVALYTEKRKDVDGPYWSLRFVSV